MNKEQANIILKNFYEELTSNNQVKASAIGIAPDGELVEDVLDGKPYNHGTAFNYMAYCFGLKHTDNISPILAAQNLADQNILAIQMRNGICLVYFPDKITAEQYDSLSIRLKSCWEKKFQFNKSTQQEGFLTDTTILEYAASIVDKCISKK